MFFNKFFLYLNRNFTQSVIYIGVLILCCTFIISVFDILNNFKSIIIPFKTIILLAFLKLPFLIGEIFPLIIFISILFTFDKLARSNELVIFLTSGINIWRVIYPVILTSFILGFLFLIVMQPISANFLNKFEYLSRKLKNNSQSSFLVAEDGLFIMETIGNENRVYTSKYVTPTESSFHNFTMIVLNKKNDFQRKIESGKAIFQKGRITLDDNILVTDKTGNEITLGDNIISTNLNFKKILEKFTSPEKISIWKLASISYQLKNSGINSDKFVNYYYKLLFRPFYIISIALVATCFINLNLRSNSNIRILAIGSIFGFLIHSFKEILTTFLISNGLSSPIAQFLPLLVLTTIAIGAIIQKFDSN